VDRRLGSKHSKYINIIYKSIDKFNGIITAVIKRSTGDQEIKLMA
jgi:hypothetical protein